MSQDIGIDGLAIGVNEGVYLEGILCLQPAWMIGKSRFEFRRKDF